MKDLVTELSQKLKINEAQAKSGAAILFKAAKNKLGSSEFDRMLGSVSGVDSLIQHAPKAAEDYWAGLPHSPVAMPRCSRRSSLAFPSST